MSCQPGPLLTFKFSTGTGSSYKRDTRIFLSAFVYSPLPKLLCSGCSMPEYEVEIVLEGIDLPARDCVLIRPLVSYNVLCKNMPFTV